MKTNYLILIIALIIFSSCNSGRYYANYRVGGKSKRENSIAMTSPSISELPSKKNEISLTEMNCLDTFTLGSPVKQQKENKLTPHRIKNKIISITLQKIKVEPIKIKKAFIKKQTKKTLKTQQTSLKKNNRFLKFLLIAGILIGLFLLAQLFGATTAFWITLGIIAAIIVGFLIALFLFVGLVFLFIEEVFGTIFLSHHPRKKSFKSVNHGERIAALFWTLIGVVILGGIISAIVFIPNFLSIALIVLVALLTAALIGAVFAAFIDFIMPGDSLFSIKSKNRKLQNNISSLLKSIVELYSKFLNKEPLSTGQYILLFLTTLLVINLVMLFVFGLAVALEVAASILFFLAGITFVVLVTTLAMWLQPKHR